MSIKLDGHQFVIDLKTANGRMIALSVLQGEMTWRCGSRDKERRSELESMRDRILAMDGVKLGDGE